jgi:hypothetical protein
MDKLILSSERVFRKGDDRKGSVARKEIFLVVTSRGLVPI